MSRYFKSCYAWLSAGSIMVAVAIMVHLSAGGALDWARYIELLNGKRLDAPDNWACGLTLGVIVAALLVATAVGLAVISILKER